MKISNKFSFLLIGIFLISFVSCTQIHEDVYKRFEEGANEVSIIVIEENKGQISRSSYKNSGSEFYSTEVSFEQLEQLNQQSVKRIEYNRPLKKFLQDSTIITRSNHSWILEVNNLNLTGKHQSVCILDTGIDTTHPGFTGRILAQKCYCRIDGVNCCPGGTSTGDSAEDDEGHGTHVAGIIGASTGISGIAPNTGLVVVKILNATGDGVTSDLINGLQWCVSNSEEYNISVISASLGGGNSSEPCDHFSWMLTETINSAVAKNISVVIASGNEGWNDKISWPSCVTNATAVSSATKNNNLATSYANRNSLVKLLGIGGTSLSMINSTYLEGTYRGEYGTSMATPMVSGAISIINQVLDLTNQSKIPIEIEEILYNTGYKISEEPNNYSRIDVYSAILSLDNIAPNVSLISPEDLTINLSQNQTFVCGATDWQLSNITFYLWNSTDIYLNETKNLTGTQNQTNFSIGELPYGVYNWNCESSDQNGNSNFSSSNFTLMIGGVNVILDSPSNNIHTNQNQKNFTCSAFSQDSYDLTNITFYLWNSTDIYLNETKNLTGTQNQTTFEYNFTEEGEYFWNCLTFNENLDNSTSEQNYSITYDTTAPLFDSVISQPTTSSTTININTQEQTNSSVFYNSLNQTNSTFSKNHSFTISGLSSSTKYFYSIISCDRAENCATYSGDFITSSITKNTGGGGQTSSASGISSSKIQNFEPSKEELHSGFTKELSKNDKIKFQINSTNHTITLLEIRNNSATFEIASDPINVTLEISEEKKINLTSEEYYDIYIKLNSIDSNKTNITIRSIYEEINSLEKIHSVKETLYPKTEEKNNKILSVVLISIALIIIISLIAHKNKIKKS